MCDSVVLIDFSDAVLPVYSSGHLCVGQLAELNRGSSNEAVLVSKTSGDIEMRDHDSSLSADSKDGTVDVTHFIQVVICRRAA